MIKKTILLLVLVTIVTGGIFAQSVWNNSFNFSSGPTPQKGALFVDLGYTIAYLLVGGFGIGLGWEGRINDSSTYLISGNIGIYGREWNSAYYGKYGYTAFDFGIEGNYRYYFFKSAIDKLFIDGGLGYGMKSWTYTYDRNGSNKTYSWGVLYIPVYAGYKIIIGPGFVLEAHAGYRAGIKVSDPDGYNSSLSIPDFGGLIFGVAIGWAFK